MILSAGHLLLAALLAADATPGQSSSQGTSIVAAGHPFEIGHPVVLWSDPQGFDAYQTRCIDQSGGCCDGDSKRYGVRKGIDRGTLDELRDRISQLVLHFDGCVNSRSCFKSMHNRPRPSGEGCGLSAHFMIDADGTIYQTLDLIERAYHAEEANSGSIGVEICNRGRVDRGEWPKLPAEYRTRPTKHVVINGEDHEAYDFRPEQYQAIVALDARAAAPVPQDPARHPGRERQADHGHAGRAAVVRGNHGAPAHRAEEVGPRRAGLGPAAARAERVRAAGADPRLHRAAARPARAAGGAAGGLLQRRGAGHRLLPDRRRAPVAFGRPPARRRRRAGAGAHPRPHRGRAPRLGRDVVDFLHSHATRCRRGRRARHVLLAAGPPRLAALDVAGGQNGPLAAGAAAASRRRTSTPARWW